MLFQEIGNIIWTDGANLTLETWSGSVFYFTSTSKSHRQNCLRLCIRRKTRIRIEAQCSSVMADWGVNILLCQVIAWIALEEPEWLPFRKPRHEWHWCLNSLIYPNWRAEPCKLSICSIPLKFLKGIDEANFVGFLVLSDITMAILQNTSCTFVS